jgi:hypothetical protein
MILSTTSRICGCVHNIALVIRRAKNYVQLQKVGLVDRVVNKKAIVGYGVRLCADSV